MSTFVGYAAGLFPFTVHSIATTNQQENKMHSQAFHAIRAAKGYNSWGAYAARRYIEKRNIPFALYRLARQLEVESKA